MLTCDIILFAETAHFAQDRKISIVDEYNIIRTTGEATIPPGRLVLRLTGTQQDVGPHKVAVRVLTADAELLAASPSMDVQVGPTSIDGTPPRAWIIAGMPPVPLGIGTYTFEVYVDAKRQDRTEDLHVVRLPE